MDIYMDKCMDSPMSPWARPMGPKMAAGPWPMGPGSWPGPCNNIIILE